MKSSRLPCCPSRFHRNLALVEGRCNVSSARVPRFEAKGDPPSQKQFGLLRFLIRWRFFPDSCLRSKPPPPPRDSFKPTSRAPPFEMAGRRNPVYEASTTSERRCERALLGRRAGDCTPLFFFTEVLRCPIIPRLNLVRFQKKYERRELHRFLALCAADVTRGRV